MGTFSSVLYNEPKTKVPGQGCSYSCIKISSNVKKFSVGLFLPMGTTGKKLRIHSTFAKSRLIIMRALGGLNTVEIFWKALMRLNQLFFLTFYRITV